MLHHCSVSAWRICLWCWSDFYQILVNSTWRTSFLEPDHKSYMKYKSRIGDLLFWRLAWRQQSENMSRWLWSKNIWILWSWKIFYLIIEWVHSKEIFKPINLSVDLAEDWWCPRYDQQRWQQQHCNWWSRTCNHQQSRHTSQNHVLESNEASPQTVQAHPLFQLHLWFD